MQPIKLIKLLRPVNVKGAVTAPVGVPFEAPAGEANVVIAMGAAEEVTPEEFQRARSDKSDRSDVVTPPGVIENRDPAPQTRDPETPPAQSSKRKRAT